MGARGLIVPGVDAASLIAMPHYGRWTADRLRHGDVEQRDPVLKRLQSETAENQADAEAPQPPLRKVVGVVVNQWNDGAPIPVTTPVTSHTRMATVPTRAGE
jgi:hypothetical protein